MTDGYAEYLNRKEKEIGAKLKEGYRLTGIYPLRRNHRREAEIVRRNGKCWKGFLATLGIFYCKKDITRQEKPPIREANVSETEKKFGTTQCLNVLNGNTIRKLDKRCYIIDNLVKCCHSCQHKKDCPDACYRKYDSCQDKERIRKSELESECI